MSAVPPRAPQPGPVDASPESSAGRPVTPEEAATPSTIETHSGGDTDEMRRTQVRGSALLMTGRVLTVLITTVTQVVLVRALTKGDFGAFAYALAIAAAGRTLLSLGQGKLLSRFMATYEEQRDYGRMLGSMVLAVGTILVTSTVSLTALFVLADVLVGSAVEDPATWKVVFILVFLAPLEALDQVFVSLFAVFSKPRTIFFRKYLFTPCLRLGVVLVLALTGSSVAFLAVGYVTAGVLGMFVYVLVLVRVLRERGLLQHMRWRRVVLPYRAVFSFSLPQISAEFVLLSLTVAGVFILAAAHPPEELATYRAVFNPARLNIAVSQAFLPLFLPLVARLFARGDVDGLRRSYWHTGAFVALLTFPVFALTGPLAPDLAVALFGAAYEDSAPVLALLSIGYYVSAALGFNSYTLQVCGRIRFLVCVNVLVAGVNIALCLLLVERYAAIGIAVASLAALVLQNLLNQWALRGAIATGFIGRGCLRLYLVIIASAGVLWVFQALVRPGLLIGLVAAAAVSLVVLVAGRNALELADTFPELRRVPVLRKLIR